MRERVDSAVIDSAVIGRAVIGSAVIAGAVVVVGALAGCNSLDAPPREGAGIVRVAPTDARTPTQSAKPAAPVMGSNLLALQTTPGTVMASDADRDRVSFMTGGTIVHVSTGEGSIPNRAVEDAAGFVHVALRGTGELAMIHPSGELVARNKICQAPRGLDLDPVSNELVVACAEGKLVRHSVDPTAYRAARVIPTDVDVRDVVVQGDRTYVSRLRSAEVLEFRGDTFVSKHTLPSVELDNSQMQTERAGSRFQATVAWKMVASPENDGVVVLHQRSLLNVVGDAPSDGDDAPQTESGSSYGGSNPQTGCSAIVQPAVSEVHSDGSVVTSDSIAGVVLAVDVVPRERFDAGDTTNRDLVIAAAGLPDPEAPVSSTLRLGGSEGAALATPDVAGTAAFAGRSGAFAGQVRFHPSTHTNPRTGDVFVGCTAMAESFSESGGGPAVSVAQNTNGELLVLQREPNLLLQGGEGFFAASRTVALGGDSAYDTGHELFHRDSGGGIACASCHPEAEDDGHVWNFASVGQRKTQFLGVPLSETAPFHWDGALTDLDVLMDEVFVARMGGVFQTPERVDALGSWVKSSEPAIAASATGLVKPDVESESAARGQVLFESKEVGCTSCHSGSAFTDNASYLVGTSGNERMQTPSLTRVALHPPFMHDGCAKTLRQRFEPACGGGDAHGKTSHLTETQIDDLVAYMNTL
jgi:mono/diheme cytochrome c family protein